MGFTALRLGFKHWEREKRFLKWELNFFPFTILFDTIAQMCLFKLKEIKFCTSRPQQPHRIMSVLFFAFVSNATPQISQLVWSFQRFVVAGMPCARLCVTEFKWGRGIRRFCREEEICRSCSRNV